MGRRCIAPMAISERQFVLGSLVSAMVLMLALSQSYKHMRHSWFFRPDVKRLEVPVVALCYRFVAAVSALAGSSASVSSPTGSPCCMFANLSQSRPAVTNSTICKPLRISDRHGLELGKVRKFSSHLTCDDLR